MSGRKVILNFALISLLLITLVACVVGWLTGSYLTRSLLEREKGLTVDYMRRVVREHISMDELRAASQTDRESQPLRTVADAFMLLPEVVRIKVYNSRGIVIWSDVPGLVGKDFHDDPSVRQALRGQVLVDLEQMDETPEHQFEHPNFSELMSIYVPIRDDRSGELLAVFEIYKYPQFLYQLISQGRQALWLVVLVGGGLVILGQFSLVRGASRTIDRQYEDLQRKADHLEIANRDLQKAQRQLIQAERMAALGEVTAAVAHGIRNPLGSIRLVSQETREGLDAQSELRRPLTEIIQQVDLLEERLRYFLNTAKPSDLSLTPVPLSNIVQGVIELMKPRLAQHGVEMTVQPHDTECVVRADSIKLEEALRILFANSIEAGARKIEVGDCRVDQDREGSRIVFHVRDDGSGFAPAAQEHLFEPFYTTKPLGTGLGLVIAKKMIEAHGGSLALEPRMPRGVDAVIMLPLMDRFQKERPT